MISPEKEIESGNILIAEFMGGKHFAPWENEHYHTADTHWYFGDGEFLEDKVKKYLMYHSSWDWLMPVVEKIRCLAVGDTPSKNILSYRIEIESHARSFSCRISKTWWERNYPQEEFICGRRGITSLIEIVFATVILFIKWYNTQSK